MDSSQKEGASKSQIKTNNKMNQLTTDVIHPEKKSSVQKNLLSRVLNTVHCPRTVGTPYFVSAPDCPADRTTIFVNPTSEEK